VQKWHENLFKDTVHVSEGIFGDLHQDQYIGHGISGDLVLHQVFIYTDFVDQFQAYDGLSSLDPI
jgi:hypothetical protein